MKKITRHYSQTLYLFVIYGFFILTLLGIFLHIPIPITGKIHWKIPSAAWKTCAPLSIIP